MNEKEYSVIKHNLTEKEIVATDVYIWITLV